MVIHIKPFSLGTEECLAFLGVDCNLSEVLILVLSLLLLFLLLVLVLSLLYGHYLTAARITG